MLQYFRMFRSPPERI